MRVVFSVDLNDDYSQILALKHIHIFVNVLYLQALHYKDFIMEQGSYKSSLLNSSLIEKWRQL